MSAADDQFADQLERLPEGDPRQVRLGDGVAAVVQRAIYRTIQEALTNVRKHAPGARVTIDIGQDDTDLTATVTNTRPTRPTFALPSARHGLVGLQERAALPG